MRSKHSGFQVEKSVVYQHSLQRIPILMTESERLQSQAILIINLKSLLSIVA